MRANRLVKKGDVGEAMALFEEVLRMRRDDVHALIGLGHCHAKAGKYSEAVKFFERAREVPSEEDEFGVFDHRYHYTLAELYEKLGRSADVVHHYEKGLTLEHVPSDRTVSYPSLYFRLAKHCKNIGAYDKALKYFTKVSNPRILGLTEGDLLCALEEVYLKLGNFDEARACMLKAAQLQVASPTSMARVATFKYNEEKKKIQGPPPVELVRHTVRDFKKALEKDSSNYLLWFQLGEVLYDGGLYEQAEEALLNALKQNRHDYSTWNLLGKVYSSIGNNDSAFAAMQRATELGKDDRSVAVKSMIAMAQIMEACGKAPEALRLYQQACSNGDESFTDSARVRANMILHKSAVRLQKAFRGFQARKRVNSVAVRTVVRNYGSRMPLKNLNATSLQKGGAYASKFFYRT